MGGEEVATPEKTMTYRQLMALGIRLIGVFVMMRPLMTFGTMAYLFQGGTVASYSLVFVAIWIVVSIGGGLACLLYADHFARLMVRDHEAQADLAVPTDVNLYTFGIVLASIWALLQHLPSIANLIGALFVEDSRTSTYVVLQSVDALVRVAVCLGVLYFAPRIGRFIARIGQKYAY